MENNGIINDENNMRRHTVPVNLQNSNQTNAYINYLYIFNILSF